MRVSYIWLEKATACKVTSRGHGFARVFSIKEAKSYYSSSVVCFNNKKKKIQVSTFFVDLCPLYSAFTGSPYSGLPFILPCS